MLLGEGQLGSYTGTRYLGESIERCENITHGNAFAALLGTRSAGGRSLRETMFSGWAYLTTKSPLT